MKNKSKYNSLYEWKKKTEPKAYKDAKKTTFNRSNM